MKAERLQYLEVEWPLKCGNTIIGGLGISGGTSEEDHSLAEYGLTVLGDIM